MNEATRVRDFVRIVVVLNLITLGAVFAGPRYFYMATHWGMDKDEVLRAEGVWDLPNHYRQSFVLAEAIRLETPKNARIFLPGGGGADMDPGPLLKTLLPRRLYFAGSAGYEEKLRMAGTTARSWKVVPVKDTGTCRKNSARKLGETGYWICRLDR
ncbi:MAG: hypothetical protein KC553_03505 [Nitrospina sp.]|nr:hypothetical protein [Nitrospina sp.]